MIRIGSLIVLVGVVYGLLRLSVVLRLTIGLRLAIGLTRVWNVLLLLLSILIGRIDLPLLAIVVASIVILVRGSGS